MGGRRIFRGADSRLHGHGDCWRTIISVVGGNLVCKMLIFNVRENDNEKNHESEHKQL